MTMVPLGDELTQLAARMSPMLLSAGSVAAALDVLTSLVQETVPGAAGAGVSLFNDQGRRKSTTATSEVVRQADDWQYRLDDGPCLTAWAHRRAIRVDDIDYDPRWPRWSRAVQPLGVLSMMSSPMVTAGRALGAVEVYSGQRAAFDARAEQLLAGVADTAALLLANVVSLDNAHELSNDLRRAVLDRDRIQLAKGILMHRDGLTEDAALQRLIGKAKVTNRVVKDVAAEIIADNAPPE
jgi:GAF domain-containing protein